MKNTFLTSFLVLSLFTIMFMFTNCASQKYENIAYLDKAVSEKTKDQHLPTLNIFSPKKIKKFSKKFDAKDQKLPVLIFVHGGNWNSGDKETYNFFICVVIIANFCELLLLLLVIRLVRKQIMTT